MSTIHYLDFDLRVERTAQGYRAQVLESPAGQASADFKLPFNDLELENLLLKIGGARRVVRGGSATPELDAAREFGGRLFESVFTGEVRGCLRSSVDEAAEEGARLRVRLHLSDAPDIADLPWEYLYNAASDKFLALSTRTPLVRYLDLPEQVRSLKVTPPLHVLVVISAPRDYQPLDTAHEWARLGSAVHDLDTRGMITLERMEDASLEMLQRRLRTGTYHILHFIGHGEFDERSGEGALIFEDEQGRGSRVSGTDLGTILQDHDPLRLAILNACEGARTSAGDPFSGVAQSLVRQGIPAVIAMQAEVSDDAAITFAHEFYGAIADSYPVDAALVEARKAMFANGDGAEWGTPVLHLRAPDGVIFDIAPGVAVPASPPINRSAPSVAAPVNPPAVEPGKRRGRSRSKLFAAVIPIAALLVLGWWFWPGKDQLICRSLVDLPMYAGPGTAYASSGSVAGDSAIKVLGRSPSGQWLQVSAADSTKGWVDARSVACNAGPERLAIIIDPPEAASAPPSIESGSNPASTASAAINLPLDLSPPRTLHYANLEMSVQDARITTTADDAAQRLGELPPDQAYAYISLRVVNPLDQRVVLERGIVELQLNGQSYQERTNWASYNYWEPQTNTTTELIFNVPRTATWDGAGLRIKQADRQPSEIALDGPATGWPYPVVLAVRGEATVDKLKYEILSAELDLDGDGQRAPTGQQFLRMKLRVTNTDPQSYGANIGQNVVRLWVSDLPQQSTHFWSDAIYANESKEGLLLFSIPLDAKTAELQVGFQDRDTARIPLNLQAPSR